MSDNDNIPTKTYKTECVTCNMEIHSFSEIPNGNVCCICEGNIRKKKDNKVGYIIKSLPEIIDDIEWGTDCLCPSCGDSYSHHHDCLIRKLKLDLKELDDMCCRWVAEHIAGKEKRRT